MKHRNWLNPRTWFGATKSVSEKDRIAYFARLGSAGWTAHEFVLFVQEGYQKNPVVRRCCSLLAKTCANLPVKLTKNGDVLDQPNHPLMLLMKRPNPEQSWRQFCEEWILYRNLSGEGPLRAITVANSVRELWVLRPDNLSILSFRNARPYQWQYTEPMDSQTSSLQNFFRPEGRKFFELMIWKEVNPLNRFRGLSPMISAAFAVDTLNSYAEANKATLDNGVTPSGVFSYRPKEGPSILNDNSYNRLKGQIDETHAGARNSGRPMLLEGGLEWVATGLSPKEMEYIAGKKLSAADVCMVYGIPPQMLGIEGSQTFANYDQARMSLYEDTAIPMMQDGLDALVDWLSPLFKEEGIRLEVDIDAIAALAPRRAEARKAVEASKSLTVNEKRLALGYDERDEGDVILVSSSEIPLDIAGADSLTLTPEEAATQAGLKPGANQSDDPEDDNPDDLTINPEDPDDEDGQD